MFASHTSAYDDLLQMFRDSGFLVAVLLLGLVGIGVGVAVWTARRERSESREISKEEITLPGDVGKHFSPTSNDPAITTRRQ
jgi:hypothetical protein